MKSYNEGKTGMEYLMRVEIEEGKLSEIMDRLEKAKDEIRNCYYELDKIGVLQVKPIDSVQETAANKSGINS